MCSPKAAVFFILLVHSIRSDSHGDLEKSNRFKRIVLGNGSAILPPRPLPIGNLSSNHGEADCYFVGTHFYCISQFLASFAESNHYCREEKMQLLYLENEEEHEYLYNFMSNNYHSKLLTFLSAGKFLKKNDFASEEVYSNYVYDNISPGMLVKCVSVCGRQIRPSIDEGRVLDYEDREYIGLAIKVQWKTGIVRWYPAQNLQMGGFRSLNSSNVRRPSEGVFTLEEDIFEPGDKVRIHISSDISDLDQQRISQQVQPGEVGIISDLDAAGGSGLVYFPSNKGWRGPLSLLEIVDKRKASGTFWTSGKKNSKGDGWIWTNNNELVTFTNWALEEQEALLIKGNCLEIKYHKQGKWFSSRCSDRNYFICKK
ncbi:uncharacterized protein LOC124198279 isoform X1 [Daphnia pulex]|uniref:uncharacterized protein LOC124198279 isoform X1 n=1 Tax=Daphnia pulex TaxID=6669 RepID=UPI001EDCCBAA|nr:uncharacterized protein LOC124198279 isoform X1 [Daphnia pulex]XP_046450034.1 uncharacterized protein LOC124198279 isoform X1 [Daphnia pulex]XP_046450035.1 uncharacterized protein LOC124198279 isoform X1 [Daphnia pulex]